MTPRHVHLLDPQLVGLGGHYFTHDAQLVDELKRRGLPCTVYGRVTLEVKTVGGTEVLPLFRSEIFQEHATDPIIWPIENFERMNREFLEDLQKLDSTRFSRDDLIYVPNILQNQVRGLTEWLCSLPEERRPAVALMFRYLNHAMDYVAKRQNKDMIALYYRFAVRDLQARHPRTVICADTTELCKAYQTITGGPVLELPNPMDVSELLAAQPPRRTDGRPVVVYQGHTSPLRGFHFLPEMIQRCQALKPRPVFTIQIQNRDKAPAMGLQPVLDLLDRMKGPDVELVEGALSTPDYLALLGRADIVLLPYTPTFYGHGSSGVFTEAASVGKVVVACNGTVPVRQGREYGLGVVGADQWTPAAMSAALANALQRLPALRTASEAGAAKFRSENCARALWDKLLAAAH
ncbi:glycosyltransferase [Nibricoccus sp. IMCC34717]|uniref:glycosyltransferase n=1 Tax=Nibricoccus sp. IMCC34717 TaxID=3034021 RepID=UPI00384CCCC0